MYIGMKTNGSGFTEVLEDTRLKTWVIGFIFTVPTTLTMLWALVYRYRRTGRGGVLLTLQALVTAVVVSLVIWFAFAIPVPPGTHSGQMFTGY